MKTGKFLNLWAFLSHANIILGVMFAVFFVLDRANPGMEFLTSNISKWLLLAFCLCAILNGALDAVSIFRKRKYQEDQVQLRNGSTVVRRFRRHF